MGEPLESTQQSSSELNVLKLRSEDSSSEDRLLMDTKSSKRMEDIVWESLMKFSFLVFPRYFIISYNYQSVGVSQFIILEGNDRSEGQVQSGVFWQGPTRFIILFITYSSQMSYGTQSVQEHRSIIEPYYVKGDVFQRDQRYYDQLPERRNRYDLNQGGRSRTDLNNSNANYGGNTVSYGGNHNISAVENDQRRRLRQENAQLINELQKLSYGGQFGNGDEVVKKNHYNASSTENARIREQEGIIRDLEHTIRLNNDKLVKYQQASHELEVRMNNIQAIDKEIYRQLKTASQRDKELLERASTALARGESKENVIRILEQVVNS